MRIGGAFTKRVGHNRRDCAGQRTRSGGLPLFDWLRGRGRSGADGAGSLDQARRDYKLGKFAEAEAALRAQLAANPRLHEARYLLGHALRAQGRLEEALDSYRQAAADKVDFADALVAAGSVLNDLGRPGDAAPLLVAAIGADARNADAYANLGNSLQYLSQLEQAITCYRQALALDPGHATAQMNLGNALSSMDRVDEAAECFRAALRLDGEFVEARWALAMSSLPAVYLSAEEANARRAALAEDWRALDAWFGAARMPLGARAVGSQQPFYLAYQEHDNREMLSRYGDLCARLMGDWMTRQGIAPAARRRPEGKLRIGVVSEYFWGHSVWNAIVKGWFENIDPERFELHAFHLGSRQDEETQIAKRRAATFEEGGRGLRPWVEAIVDRGLDVLIYPNIGNDPMALKLASLRLVPVQVTSWGHPETTGLPTMDYFLSAQAMEPKDADRFYREKLVRLPHLGTHYRPKAVTPVDPRLDELGLDEGRPILLCPGTPFKYSPAYDAVIVELCRRIGRCQIVFFEEPSRHHATDRLRGRLASSLAVAGLRMEDHVVFVPWLDAGRYHGLMERADVLLDTIGFSGFNIAIQAIERCLPVVAWEGRFLRGRLASGILHQLELQELVARSADQYVGAVVCLVQDQEHRVDVRARMANRRSVLFEDAAPVRALEDFLDAVGRGGGYPARDP
jgi:protein O-GlcNAc transferase